MYLTADLGQALGRNRIKAPIRNDDAMTANGTEVISKPKDFPTEGCLSLVLRRS